MLSVEDLAATKIAIALCNTSELKKEIFNTPVEDDNTEHETNYEYKIYREIKKKLDENLEKKSFALLNILGLGVSLRDKVVGFVLLIAMRMLAWVKYHQRFLDISQGPCCDYLKIPHFTSRGTIDSKKAAKEMMDSQRLSAKQRYKLACLYCFADQISVLFRQMAKKEQEEFIGTPPDFGADPDLVKSWSYLVMDEAEKLLCEKSLGEYLLDKAIQSGSKAAIEFCLDSSVTKVNKTPIKNMALKVVKNITYIGYSLRYDLLFVNDRFENGWTVFKNLSDWQSSCNVKKPSDNFKDILRFLFDKMPESQRVEFLMEDVQSKSYRGAYFGILSVFLDWPYQSYFMKAIKLTWDFLPVRIFADLLVNICCKIEAEVGTLKYGEGKTFNYRKLFKEFWCAAPLRHKRYIFANIESVSRHSKFRKPKSCEHVIRKLFSLQKFTNDDIRIIDLILESATDEEKKKINRTNSMKILIFHLIKAEKWERLNILMSYLFSSCEQVDKFRLDFIFSKRAQEVCIMFVEEGNLEAAESFIKWSAITEEQIFQLKREIILSYDVKKTFKVLVTKNSSIIFADKFCEWLFSSKEDSIALKRSLIYSEIGDEVCSELVRNDRMGNVIEFVNWCLSSAENITNFKENFVCKHGGILCKHLISNWHDRFTYCGRGYGKSHSPVIFDGGKWEQVERFLAWGFPSLEGINSFKKKELYEIFAEDILFDLFYANQLKEADTFFYWLGLSFDEIKNLKNKFLYSHKGPIYGSIYGTINGKFLCSNGDRRKYVKRFLRWFLTDLEDVHQVIGLFGEIRDIKNYEMQEYLFSKFSEDELKDDEKVSKMIEELFSCLVYKGWF